MKKVSPSLSIKVSRLSFVCALLVVAIHCTVGDVLHPNGAFGWCQVFVNRGLTRMAVPFFFIVFGFFLFKDFEFSFAWWERKLINRAQTLLVPYWAWSVIGILNLAIWNLFRRHPVPMDWCNFEWWLKVLGITEAPIGSTVLWFVRVLLVAVLVSPILGVAVKRMSWGVPLFFLILQVVGVSNYCGNFFYVSVGAKLATMTGNCLERRFTLKRTALLVGMAWMSLIAIKTVLDLYGIANCGSRALCECMNVAGIVFVWMGYDCIARMLMWLDPIAKSSFFLYCAHPHVSMYWQYPLIHLSTLSGHPWIFFCIAYVGMVVIPILLWGFLGRIAPRWMRLALSGGR